MSIRAFAWPAVAALVLFACSEDELTGLATIVQISVSNAGCANLVVGGTCQLTVTVIDSDGQVVEDPRLDWTSENIVFATVSASGVVTGVRQGTATIRVATPSGTISDETTVLVRPAAAGPPDDGPAP